MHSFNPQLTGKDFKSSEPTKPKFVSREEQILNLKSDLKKNKEDQIKVLEDKGDQNLTMMNKMLEKCKYDVIEKDIYFDSSKEVLRTRQKIDLKQFRAAYLSTNVNEDIKHNITWNKIKKEEKQI